MSNDPSQRADSPDADAASVPPEELQTEQPQAEQPEPKTDDSPEAPPSEQRILIGSQRDPDAYRPKPRRDWKPLKEKKPKDSKPPGEKPAETPPAAEAPPAADTPPAEQEAEAQPPEPAAVEQPVEEPAVAEAPPAEPEPVEPEAVEPEPVEPEALEPEPVKPLPPGSFPPPSVRDKLPPELEQELEEAMGDASLDDLMADSETVSRQQQLEPESRHTGRVVVVQREDVFVELGSREQGIIPLKQFEEPPQPDTTLDVIVVRFNAEDGLYELMLPHASADVADWSDLSEGLTVEARITGHNTGGLECEVNHIRGFIPVSQIALYHVDDMAEFVDQKLTCLVTEVNPGRNNLVLSRRAMLEREREQARKELLESLAPGQIHEGVVRKLMDFGAFVDLGGVDGLLHISQLGWDRVAHPSDVLSEGQTIKVKVEKVDLENNRISLGYRDMLANPWTDAESKYPVHSTIRGTVSKLMDFGAFVKLEPGVEGLVHVSELSHKRVWRPSDVVAEGDEVEAVVLSVDQDAQRISLSIKDTLPVPKKAKEEDESAAEPAEPAKPVKKRTAPLKGGLGGPSGGEQFGLKW